MKIIIWLLLTFCLLAASTPFIFASIPTSDLLNALYISRGDQIPTNPILMEIAQERAQEISINFSHDEARAPWQWGEVLAFNSFEDTIAANMAVQGLLNSPSHAIVILGTWTHVGVGIYEIEDLNYFVCLFANIPIEEPHPATEPLNPIITLPPTDTKT